MSSFLGDLRYGVRMLLRSPGTTGAAILALALGIGANTSIFSVVDAILLRPLPYADPDGLVRIHQTWSNDPDNHDVLSVGDIIALREDASALGQIAAYYAPSGGFALTGAGEPVQVAGTAATSNLFEVLGVRPLLGRGFAREDDAPGAEPVAVISHALWQRRFGGDPSVVGRVVALNDRSYTIVGIMPAGFRFPREPFADLWAIFRPERTTARPPFFVDAVARPRPGTDPSALRNELAAITRRIKAEYPGAPSDWTLGVTPLKDEIIGDVRPALLVLLGAVTLVLLITTANIANLLLARATARRREMAVRSALGAGRLRLARQLLTESLLLAAVGGALGVVLSLWGTDLLVRIGPRDLPRLNEVGLDLRILLYTAGTSIVCGLLFGLAPALQIGRGGLSPALAEGGRGGTDRTGHRIRNLLVVSEFALAVMLLIGAGLLIRSFQHLVRVSPGFDSGGILTASLSLPQGRYPDEPARSAFFRKLLDRTRELPGVDDAAISMALPPNLLVMTNPYAVEGRPPAPGQHAPAVPHLLISPGFFRVLGVPLLRGRAFTDDDNARAPGVIVVNQTMASQLFPGEDPVGKRLQLGDPDSASPWLTIVGVVADVKYTGLDAASTPTMYTPYEQSLWWPTMYLAVRSHVEPAVLERSVRAQVATIDPLLPVARVRTMREIMGRSVAEPRFRTMLLGLFAGIALVLATVGIYGILSYTVAQRSQEIGIRMALGARHRDVMTLVLKQGMALACAGVAIGLAAALALSRVLAGLLFGVGPLDGTTFLAVGAVMSAAALLACYLPARRATRVDPMVALRAE